MSYFFKASLILSAFASGLLLVSCAGIPRVELDAAQKMIIESEKLNAPKYAPDELNFAKQYYSTATNQVTLKKNKDAKESAIDSRRMADRAYFKSLDEFVKDQNDGTQKNMDEAKDSHADVAVPDKFAEAQKLFDEAQKDMNDLKTETLNLQQLNAQTGVTNK